VGGKWFIESENRVLQKASFFLSATELVDLSATLSPVMVRISERNSQDIQGLEGLVHGKSPTHVYSLSWAGNVRWAVGSS
jgi:hypothetical protein